MYGYGHKGFAARLRKVDANCRYNNVPTMAFDADETNEVIDRSVLLLSLCVMHRNRDDPVCAATETQDERCSNVIMAHRPGGLGATDQIIRFVRFVSADNCDFSSNRTLTPARAKR